MPNRFRGIDQAPGWQNRKFRALDAQRLRDTSGRVLVAMGQRIKSASATAAAELTEGLLLVRTPVNPDAPDDGVTLPGVTVDPQGVSVEPSSGLAARFGADASGRAAVSSTAGEMSIPFTTTSASANVQIDSGGVLRQVSSSRRYKQDITDAEVDPAAVLRMRPRMWRDRREVERDPDEKAHYVGFIAEELHDARLRQFVIYDDQGRPEAIAYDRLSAALVVLAQAQQTQIDRLGERLDALEAQQ